MPKSTSLLNLDTTYNCIYKTASAASLFLAKTADCHNHSISATIALAQSKGEVPLPSVSLTNSQSWHKTLGENLPKRERERLTIAQKTWNRNCKSECRPSTALAWGSPLPTVSPSSAFLWVGHLADAWRGFFYHCPVAPAWTDYFLANIFRHYSFICWWQWQLNWIMV